MQGYRQNEQQATLPMCLDPFGLSHRRADMQMGEKAIGRRQKNAPGQEPYDRRQPARNAVAIRQFDGRGQQRPETGGQHDPGSKAHHAVQQLAVNRSGEKHDGRAECGHAPGKTCSQQCLKNRV